VSPSHALKTYGRTLYQLIFAIITIVLVLALAYVLNISGMTITLGRWMAEAGGVFDGAPWRARRVSGSG
jgi:lactate permease